MLKETIKSKSMRDLEERMSTVEPGSLRYQILENARDFKSSWIALGQCLYTVYKDKMYKEWGYQEFASYCKAEIGIQQTTASKLLNSYYFLERKEPEFLRSVVSPQKETAPEPKTIPSYEAVNVLRLASQNKELSEDDYQEFRKSVFEQGQEDKDVKKAVGLRMRSLREEEDPQTARDNRRRASIRRLLSTIKSMHKELVYGHLVSDRTAREMEKLMTFLSEEIGSDAQE